MESQNAQNHKRQKKMCKAKIGTKKQEQQIENSNIYGRY